MSQIGQLGFKSGDSLLEFLDLVESFMNVGVKFLVFLIELVKFLLLISRSLQLLL